MIVYHGSTLEITAPNVSFSKNYLDFGKGFYVTTFREQAEKWALRKALRQRTNAIVNVYEMNENLSNYKVLAFDKENEEWLDFVCACRGGKDIYKNYDIIMGNVANDDVFKTIEMYFRGHWDKERTLKELRYYKLNDQICFINQNVLDEVLCFVKSYIKGDESNG